MTVNTLTLYMPGSSVGIQVYEGSQLHLILVSQGANSIPSAPGQVVRADPFPQYVDDDELAAALAGVGGGYSDLQAVDAVEAAATVAPTGAWNFTQTPTVAGVPVGGGGGAVLGQQPALGILRAGLATRKTTPCRVVFTGSSTTEGALATTFAGRWVNRVVAAMQTAYPSGLSSETTVINSPSATWGTLSTAAGVHGYNAGESGTDSGSYLTAGEITSIANLGARAVIHMIGSNDFANSVPVATYKANLQAAITALKAQQTSPCVHILVHTYERFDVTGEVAPWSAYGDAARQIAEADPNNVAFIDLSPFYPPVGVSGADALGLIDTDNVHQTDAGHAFMGDLVTWKLDIAIRDAVLEGLGTILATPSTIARRDGGGWITAAGFFSPGPMQSSSPPTANSDLTRKDYVDTAVAGKVTGTGITETRALTQAAYDALGTKSATTLYVIVG